MRTFLEKVRSNFGVLFLVFIVFIASYITIQAVQDAENVHQSEEKFEENAERLLLSKEIDVNGASNAYKTLKSRYRDQNILVAHSAAHIFGELLYSKFGKEGIEICDQSYLFGCYHGFVGRFIANTGTTSPYILEDICPKEIAYDLKGCTHGMGHGILSYLGGERLNAALESCSFLTESGINWCAVGVFMEYNLNNSHNLNFDIGNVRQIKGGDFYFPCTSVKEEYQPDCYFELPDWWLAILRNDVNTVMSLCEKVNADTNRQMCFIGLGRSLALYSGLNDAKTNKCAFLNSPNEIQLCRIGYFMRIYEYTLRESDALLACDNFDNEEHKECIATIDFFVFKPLIIRHQ